MRQTDVAIVGGGFAGSAAAAMLGRAGIAAVLIDPHTIYPPDFRCEKFDASQVALLRKAGIADVVLPATAPNTEIWVARRGRIVEKRASEQYGASYHTMVNAARAAIASGAAFIAAKAVSIGTSGERQTLTLSDGQEVSARLVILANGLNAALRRNLGLECATVSACHSISIGFDIAPAGRRAFEFPALTYFPEGPAQRMAYLTLFPVGGTLRANLFVYRGMNDPWLSEIRKQPESALLAMMPKLGQVIGPFRVTSDVRIRPVDLYATQNASRPGMVVVGDAFATSCPAAGTGLNKVLTDIERLCGTHIPEWLATEGMPEAKIAAFYNDPVKQACDRFSLAKAYRLRSASISMQPHWLAFRWSKRAGRMALAGLREWRRRTARSPLATPAISGERPDPRSGTTTSQAA